MAPRYLDIADFLLIGEEVLGIEAEVLEKMANLPLADSALNAPAGWMRARLEKVVGP
ncbi:MAG: hypothetical protein HY775_10280 [Acidobacteria bacterium]|nr:hypothetical protein [Acidobacteriota bacterium]